MCSLENTKALPKNIKKSEDPPDWTDAPDVKAVNSFIWNQFNNLSQKTFYDNDPSDSPKEFKEYCEQFADECENELTKFRKLVANLKVD